MSLVSNKKVYGLKFVPAGLYPRVFMAESSLYVKMLPFSKHRASIAHTEISRTHVVLNLYDRDVHIVRNTTYAPDLDFDFMYNLSIFANDNIFKEQYGVEQVLMSAHNGMHELKKDYRDLWRPQNPDIKIFGDSGGAQLRIGTTPYIDPEHVADWMNDFVDVGASLDIVPRPKDQGNDKTLWGLAEAQRRCNEIFMARKKNPDLKFSNVVHGFSLRDSRMWCDRVKMKNPDFIRWAVGTDNNYSFLNVLLVAMTPMLEYEEYGGKGGLHFFGMSGKTFVPILAWLAKKTGVPVTMDSTNYLRGNRYRRYHALDLKGKMYEVVMGNTAQLQPRTKLLCQCPICHSIGWWEAFNLPGGSKMQHMLTMHNLFVGLSFANWWSALADKIDDVEVYKKLVEKIYMKSDAYGTNLCIDFVDCIVEYGLSKSEKKFRQSIVNNADNNGGIGMDKLFPGEGPRSNFEGEMNSMVGQKFMDSSDRILHRYIPKSELKKLWKKHGIH